MNDLTDEELAESETAIRREMARNAPWVVPCDVLLDLIAEVRRRRIPLVVSFPVPPSSIHIVRRDSFSVPLRAYACVLDLLSFGSGRDFLKRLYLRDHPFAWPDDVVIKD